MFAQGLCSLVRLKNEVVVVSWRGIQLFEGLFKIVLVLYTEEINWGGLQLLLKYPYYLVCDRIREQYKHQHLGLILHFGWVRRWTILPAQKKELENWAIVCRYWLRAKRFCCLDVCGNGVFGLSGVASLPQILWVWRVTACFHQLLIFLLSVGMRTKD